MEYLQNAWHKGSYILKLYAVQDPETGSKRDELRAYNLFHQYIGSEEMARELIYNWGIIPEVDGSLNVKICTIGFCQREQRWYAWNRLSIASFGIGDKLFDPIMAQYMDALPWRTGIVDIVNLEQAKEAAQNYSRFIRKRDQAGWDKS